MEFKETFEETVQRLAKSDTKTRGDLLKVVDQYLAKIGKKDLFPQIEEKMIEFGYSFKPKDIKAMNWYPIAMETALLFSLIEVLNWDEEEIKKFGRSFTKLSLIEKLLVKYFVSMKKTFSEAPRIWKRHMGSGELEAYELNEKEKYCILRLKGLDLYPLYCVFLSGMFETMAAFITQAKKNYCQESKCTFRGDSYHEFILRWE